MLDIEQPCNTTNIITTSCQLPPAYYFPRDLYKTISKMSHHRLPNASTQQINFPLHRVIKSPSPPSTDPQTPTPPPPLSHNPDVPISSETPPSRSPS